MQGFHPHNPGQKGMPILGSFLSLENQSGFGTHPGALQTWDPGLLWPSPLWGDLIDKLDSTAYSVKLMEEMRGCHSSRCNDIAMTHSASRSFSGCAPSTKYFLEYYVVFHKNKVPWSNKCEKSWGICRSTDIQRFLYIVFSEPLQSKMYSADLWNKECRTSFKPHCPWSFILSILSQRWYLDECLLENSCPNPSRSQAW